MPDPTDAPTGLPDPSTPGYALTRADLEAEEERRLAPYAMKSARARRRLPLETEGRHFDYRTEYQRDRDRILYSRSFRRLRQKTQVFLPGGGDHYRNRMTHTMEVAQISRTIARALRLNEDLVEAICLGHDLGHPPFAHSGEKVLHEILAGEAPLADLPVWPGGDLGGFKHNYQSLRVVDRLEKQYPHPGLNLTCEVREGILKHTGLRSHIAYPDLDGESVRLGKPCFFEGQVGALADDLAQQIHDCDDGMRDGLVEIGEVESLGVAKEIAAKSGTAYTGVRSSYVRRNLLIRGMTHLFVTNVIARSAENLRRFAESTGLRTTEDFYARLDAIPAGMIQLTERGFELYEELREFVYRRVISSLVVSRADVRARMFVLGLFRAYYADPRLLEDYVLLRFKETAGPPYLRDVPLNDVPAEIARRYHGNPAFIRLVCDHIAGMTDKYAVEEYDRIYSVHPGPRPALP